MALSMAIFQSVGKGSNATKDSIITQLPNGFLANTSKTHGLDFDEDPTDLILMMLKFSLRITAVSY